MAQSKDWFTDEIADEIDLDDLGVKQRFPGPDYGMEQWANHRNAETKQRQEEQSAK
ncbi:MAG: hypothetical protein GX295_03535 [Syntrophomonadaceae bacterium]|nr:hypothetical protein [Syntrophomonadaceae bacterium]